jgi:KDO2-lipid IV(A) lauroyltransferase
MYLSVRLISYVPLPLGRFTGKMLAVMFSLIPLKRNRISFQNLQSCFGERMIKKDLKRLYSRVARHFGQMIFEIPHIMKFTKENLDLYVEFSGEDNLTGALNKGKGVFILTGHFGNWEWMSAAISLRFGSLSIVARPFNFPPAERLMGELRSRFGSEIIPKQKAMRRLLSAIKQKRIVGILLDQNVDWYDGVFVDFLGREACTNKGLALMALKTGAPVIPAFPVRRKDGKYRICIGREIDLIRTYDKAEDVQLNTALFTAVIGDYVKRYPDHWFWFHRRWKTKSFCRLPDDFYPYMELPVKGSD